jgi:5-methylcytosine-specific restriction protein B
MDYEEFVDGYKPDIGMNGLPTFELRDGPFKQICRNCLGGTDESAFEEAWEKFIESIDDDDKDFIEAKTVKRNKTFYYRLTENGAIQVSSNSDWNYAIPISKQQVRKFILENNKPYHQSYVKGIAKVLQDEFGAPIRKSAIRKPHVLIIDEINRGNVSKIFGELITLLETDKRESEDGEIGETLSVALTYSQDKMVVPHNLFIIGTMNTADRSLGQIDYALRRRFAFIELNADKAALEQYYSSRLDGPKDRAIFLFSSVEKFLEMENIVNHDFDVKNIMIGHSYFMAETMQALSMKMRYEVIPLLEEYRHDGILNCIGTDDDYLRLLEVLRSE